MEYLQSKTRQEQVREDNRMVRIAAWPKPGHSVVLYAAHVTRTPTRKQAATGIKWSQNGT